jgi:branched-chain amino acid transport system ATP-binding protein
MNAQSAPMSPILKVDRVSKRFGGLQALDGVEWEIGAGRMFAIIGPNGAGKTTLFSIIAGSQPPTEGRIWLEGRDITPLGPEERCTLGVARTFQVPRPFAALSVLDNVAVGCLDASRNVAEARSAAMSVLETLDMPQHAEKRAGSLSIGLRKRLEVAKALGTRPKVLLLDEVMGGLHGSEVDDMIETVRRLNRTGVTIVLIEHVLPAVMALAESVTVLDQGRVIASGAPREVTRDPAVIDAYLGDELVG